MSSCHYRKSHCGDKTILWPSYLHNGISYTGKITFLYWIRALDFCVVRPTAAMICNIEDRGTLAFHEERQHYVTVKYQHSIYYLRRSSHEAISTTKLTKWRIMLSTICIKLMLKNGNEYKCVLCFRNKSARKGLTELRKFCNEDHSEDMVSTIFYCTCWHVSYDKASKSWQFTCHTWYEYVIHNTVCGGILGPVSI